ncbi:MULTISPECIES: hypothetical protein [unclassified Brevundimonas]|uniref:hypothetical protein n=1 Tax=unclassified Brevundimonas TaxID=2622653 RepID=UPI0025C25551|nr:MULTISPECIES: hypothetical protein [unclassified Brevundimonas]
MSRSNNAAPGHHRYIPDSWPALLSKDQLRAYVGGMSEETLSKVCPVAPVDLGANLLRYPRHLVDAWIAELKPRVGGFKRLPHQPTELPDEPPIVANDHAAQALERVRSRAKGSQR